MKKTLALAGLLMMSACTTMSYDANKTLTVEPSATPTLIAANAHTACKDYFFAYKCTTLLNVKPVK